MIADTQTALVVGHRGEHTPRLVEDEVLQILIDVDAHPVDADDVDVRVDAHTLPGHDLPVDLDPALLDEDLRVAAGGDTGLGQHLLQAHALGGGLIVIEPVGAEALGDRAGGGLALLR